MVVGQPETAIRAYKESDLASIEKLHRQSGLPAACMPDLSNPLFHVKVCAVRGGRVAQAAFVKLVGEGFVLVDHEIETPQERLATLERLINGTLAESAARGLEEVTSWLPPQVEKSFGPRLLELGAIRSPWPSFTFLLR